MRIVHWIGIVVTVAVVVGPLARWAAREAKSPGHSTIYFSCVQGFTFPAANWTLAVYPKQRTATLRSPSGTVDMTLDSFGPDVIEASWWVKDKPYRIWINRLRGSFDLSSFDKSYHITGSCEQQMPSP
jgi:hypothetical protein